MRRLSSTQYRNSLLALFNNDTSLPSEDVLADPAVNGFRIDADAAVVENLDAELLMNYAETVAEWAVTGNRIASFTNDCTNNDDNCRSNFVRNFGQRVQREPLSEERQKFYTDMMKAEADAGGTFNDAAKLVVSALLQSPYFLYRRELGTPSGSEYTLTPHEVASELAFFLTESPPDEELRKAAAEGRLASREDIDKQVSRLLETEQAKHALEHFVHGWLEIENLPTKAKDVTKVQFDAALGEDMLSETDRLFVDALFGGKDVAHLLTANYTFLNDKLSALYQLPGGGSGFQRVELMGTNRARGLLGQGAFLTMHSQAEFSSPVQRGKIVRERLLCQDLPPVPADLDTNLDRMTTFTTNRERYEQHSTDVVCASCHQAMDPVGFAFEHYDEFGRYRTEEGGKPIDSTGLLKGMPEGDVPLEGVDSVIDYLAQSDAVRSCLVRYWSYFAYGRDEWQEKICNQDFVRREAAGKGYTLRSVLDGIVHAPHFTRRVEGL